MTEIGQIVSGRRGRRREFHDRPTVFAVTRRHKINVMHLTGAIKRKIVRFRIKAANKLGTVRRNWVQKKSFNDRQNGTDRVQALFFRSGTDPGRNIVSAKWADNDQIVPLPVLYYPDIVFRSNYADILERLVISYDIFRQ